MSLQEAWLLHQRSRSRRAQLGFLDEAAETSTTSHGVQPKGAGRLHSYNYPDVSEYSTASISHFTFMQGMLDDISFDGLSPPR